MNLAGVPVLNVVGAVVAEVPACEMRAVSSCACVLVGDSHGAHVKYCGVPAHCVPDKAMVGKGAVLYKG